MSVCAFIFRECPIRLWGLTSRERLQRVLKSAGITQVAQRLSAVPDPGSVLLLRGDYLYDDRVIRSLAETVGVVLQVPAGNSQIPVAAHVASDLAPQARIFLSGTSNAVAVPDVPTVTPETLCSSYQQQLRKFEPPFVLAITQANRRELEKHLFAGSYKGVTDLITKWLWPMPAQWTVRFCVRYGLRPNQVTLAGFFLAILAGSLFAYGQFGWGLATGWLMTFLDTVDGKLARVTVTSSRFGHIFDHAIDLIHPPLWYIAWGAGLDLPYVAITGLTVNTVYWTIVIAYIAGRLVEGIFEFYLGRFGIFCWRPADSYFRLITARRNPNLILLTAGAWADRPDLGLLAVVFWTVLTSLILIIRLVQAARTRLSTGPLTSWLAQVDPGERSSSLAARLFTRRAATTKVGSHE